MSTDATGLPLAPSGKPGGKPTPPSGAATLFTRKSSGLVREVGVLSAVGISISSVILTAVVINMNNSLTSFARADLYVPIILGGVIWLVAMFAYKALVEAIPRAGGEYVYVSRIISPFAGAAVGMFVAVALTYTAASLAHVDGTTAPFTLTALGSAFHSSAITNAANDVTTNTWVLVISCVIMVLAGIVAMASLRFVAKLMVAAFVFQFVAVFAVAVLLATQSHSDFVSAFAGYSHHPGAYQAIISAGKANGVALGASFGAMLAAIPFFFLAFNGVLFSYYVGGELRRPSRTYLYASAIAIGVEALVYLGLWALMRHTIGLNFMQAQSNLAVVNPGKYASITDMNGSLTAFSYGLVLSGDPITKILIGLAIPVGFTACAVIFVVATARVLMAQAFDRILPSKLGDVSQRTHTPVVAIAIVTVVAVGFCVLTVYTNFTSIFALLSLFLCLIMMSGATAALFLPYRRPDLIIKPGEKDVRRWLGIPRVSWYGGGTLALGLFCTIEVMTHPAVYGGFSFGSITTLVVVIVAGPIIYLIARAVARRTHQIDPTLAMHELPPD
jgi:basic amino acid/polyamine antiporter, APA family